jgi:hypothetical protein
MFGANHPVIWDKRAQTFFAHVDVLWQESSRGRAYYGTNFDVNPSKNYSLYDDPAKNLGVFVLERHLSAKQASRNRLRWTRHDVGRIKQDIANELAADGDLPETLLREVELSTAVRVSDIYSQGEGSQLALIVRQSSRAAGLLLKEHQLSVAGLGRNLKNFTYPYSDYIPNLKLGRLFKGVDDSRVEQSIEAVQSILPITLELAPIQFYSHQEVV